MLERLTPDERAAFLLREVFDTDYPDVARTLGKSEAACRQLVSRARAQVREGRARFAVSREEHLRLLERFAAAAREGAALANSTLGKKLLDLVFLRVSQLNGCAYCVDLHVRDLLAQGEDLQRLNSLVTWREVSLFSERAALNWAESLTRLADTHAADEDYTPLAAHFSDRETAELTMAVALMNAWNRLGVGMRLPVRAAPLKVAA